MRRAMQTGPFAQALFPNGQFIGEDGYANFVQNYFRTSIQEFETQVKKELEINRLEAMVTGGVTVSDQDVRDSYRQQATKIKFDYAVINAEDLRKQINPTDAELQAFFKQSAARYKDAIPETRKLTYIALNQTDVPGGTPAVPDQQSAAVLPGASKGLSGARGSNGAAHPDQGGRRRRRKDRRGGQAKGRRLTEADQRRR